MTNGSIAWRSTAGEAHLAYPDHCADWHDIGGRALCLRDWRQPIARASMNESGPPDWALVFGGFILFCIAAIMVWGLLR